MRPNTAEMALGSLSIELTTHTHTHHDLQRPRLVRMLVSLGLSGGQLQRAAGCAVRPNGAFDIDTLIVQLSAKCTHTSYSNRISIQPQAVYCRCTQYRLLKMIQ